MQRRFSLTERVVWAVTATVALLVGLQSVLAFVAMHVQEDEMTDTMLQREVQQVVAHTLQPGLTPTGTVIESTRVQAWLTRGSAGAGDMPNAMRGLTPGLYQLAIDNETLHVAVTDTEDGRLTVSLDATAEEARVQQFGLTLLGLWLVCVAATVWIARAVAAVAVEPIVAAARNIARSSPDQRSVATGRSDEAGVLMETFNRFRDRVDDMVAREREFAANLDHEIRTPLTSIRTDAELLGLEARLEPAQRARLDRIIASVDEISATTEATLSHSAGRFGDEEKIDLHELLRAACDAMADRAAARDLHIAVAVAVGTELQASRQAVLTIVRNLLRNAVEHAAPATLTISGDGRALSFADDGPGIDATVQAHVFDRHHHGQRVDEGAVASQRQRGLGLAIARRLCDMQGWRLAVESPAPTGGSRGTVFTLDFGVREPVAAA